MKYHQMLSETSLFAGLFPSLHKMIFTQTWSKTKKAEITMMISKNITTHDEQNDVMRQEAHYLKSTQ